jgi:hypothetical protein
MQSSRRDFLVTAGVGAAGMLMYDPLWKKAVAASQNPAVKQRHEVLSTEAAQDVASYKKAVKAMMALNANDPRNWTQQAYIHGQQFFNKCQHGNWFFFPWHRAYLYYMEELVRKYSGNQSFALPYWDWSRTDSLPAPFRNDPASSLYNATRNPGINAGLQFTADQKAEYVGMAKINQLLSISDFTTYGGGNPGAGQLETTPHNFIHVWVGGDMVQADSPLDPIFYLHHCNVDRLYSEWLSRTGHSRPPQVGWQNRSFADFVTSNGNQGAGGVWNCKKMLNTEAMGYRYRNKQFRLAASSRIWKRTGILSALTSSTSKGVMSFAAAVPNSAVVAGLNEAAAGESHRSVRLRLEGVKTPKDHNVSIRVFINCRNPSQDTPISDPSYVGSFTFFHGPHGKDGKMHDATIYLDATSAFRNLYGDTDVPDDKPVQITLISSSLLKNKPTKTTVEEVKPSKIHVEVITRGE